MKTNHPCSGTEKLPLKKHVASFLANNMKKIIVLSIVGIALAIGCAKKQQVNTDQPTPGNSKLIVNSAQPLPQGKTNFSVTMGNFDNVGRTWVRIINWTFNASNGTVAATSWTWFSDVKTGTGAFAGGSHTCTMDGVTSVCDNYVPAGWNTTGASIHQSWSGSYTYNTSTHALNITWATIDGVATTATDAWDVTLPQTGLARVNLTSSNYSLTHGRGYGSNAAWTVYKNISQIVAAGMPNFTGSNPKHVYAHQDAAGTLTILPTQPVGGGAWEPAAFNITGSTTPSNPTPAVTLHHYNSAAGGCTASCQTSRTGNVTHFTVSGTNRQVGYSVFCACLPSNAEWPCYSGNRHPFALMQIIDDSGALQAYVGIEAQNKSGYADFQFQCVDYSNIP